MGLRTTRMEAFSDGVFAIAITLLVLEIGVPEGSGDDLVSALAEEWPSYLAYLVSFSSIGAIWLLHTVVTEFIKGATSVFVRLNLLLLLVVSFLPFPTRLMAEYISDEASARVAATVYGVNLLLCAVLVSVLWRDAVGEHLVKGSLSDDDVRTITRKLTPSMASYMAFIAVGLFAPELALLGYLLVALFIMLPLGALRRSSHTS